MGVDVVHHLLSGIPEEVLRVLDVEDTEEFVTDECRSRKDLGVEVLPYRPPVV